MVLSPEPKPKASVDVTTDDMETEGMLLLTVPVTVANLVVVTGVGIEL